MSTRGDNLQRKLDLRISKTKTALHHALLQLLNEQPLEKISITELCRTAKVNRGTFYLHYTDIDDLFTEVFKEIMQNLRLSYQKPHIQTPNFTVEQLHPNNIQIFQHIHENLKFYEIIFSKNVPIMYYYLLFEEINVLVKRDIITDESIDEELYAAYHTNAILGIIIHWHKTGFTMPVTNLNKQLANILINTRKQH